MILLVVVQVVWPDAEVAEYSKYSNSFLAVPMFHFQWNGNLGSRN